MFKKIKKSIHKFLDEMAKENQELYGKERMDCCKLNKTNNKSTK